MIKIWEKFKAYYRRMRKFTYEFCKNDKYSRPSLNGLDRKLEKYLDLNDGYFIEAGANDGFNQSNTYYFEKFRNWKGLLIEAIPDLYKQCKTCRGKSIVLNYALVSNRYEKSTVLMQYANLMSFIKQKGYVQEQMMNNLDNALKIQDIAESFVIEVPARTLTSILDEVNPPKIIDLLSLDVEGYECEVLNGLNFEKYKPRYICVEVRDKQSILDLLENYYEQVCVLSDTNGLSDILFKAK